MARLNIRHTNIHKAADLIRVGEGLSITVGLSGVGPPPTFTMSHVFAIWMPGRTLAVASAQNAAAEDLFIEISRSIDVGNGNKECDGEPVAGGISLLFCSICTLFIDGSNLDLVFLHSPDLNYLAPM